MASPLTVLLGGDLLAFRVCEELVASGGRVVVIADANEDVAAEVARLGAHFVPRRGDERAALSAAGIGAAHVAMALTEDDHANLQFALAARDLNVTIRIVMRQFNRTLGRKIEDSLPNCSVVSLSSLSAATYAAAALDPACYYGVEFPYVDGRLVGFSRSTAAASGIGGSSVDAAEARLRMRIVTCNGRSDYDRSRLLEPDDALTLFSTVARRGHAPRRARSLMASLRRARDLGRVVLRPDPVVRGAIAVALATFASATFFFAMTMKLGAVEAAYFVLSTMTTTGYGDITPARGNVPGELAAMLLMVGGIAFSGIFIAVMSSRFTQAQYIATQGLRRVSQRDHIVVFGAGNVGSRVIEYLVAAEAKVVVVEILPRPEMIERSRAGHFDLLTGDASKDRTLDLCNITEAAAVIALTNSDTLNLEAALGTRARNPDACLVMRVQHRHFGDSVRKHFGLDRVFGTAALAAPVFVGLAYDPGMRGELRTDAGNFAIAEMRVPASGIAPAPGPGCIPLAIWRDGRVVAVAAFDDASPHDVVLSLVPVRNAPAGPRMQ